MTQRYFIVGLEGYRPQHEGQELDLRKGFWIPELQMNGEYLASQVGAETALPQNRSTTIGNQALDRLMNRGATPLIVRALNMTWAAAYLTTDYSHFSMRVDVYGVDEAWSLSPTVSRAPFNNAPKPLLGSLDNSGVFLFRLARPFLLRREEGVTIRIGAATDEVTFDFTTISGQAATDVEHVIFARGVNTGRAVEFATPAPGSNVATASYVNNYDEDLEIYAVAGYCPDSVNYRPVVEITTGAWRWSSSERPLWLFAEPFSYARYDFSHLPRGGLLLKPGEGFSFTLNYDAV